MKNVLSTFSFVLIALLFFARPVHASNIIGIAMAPQDIPFLLDDNGQIWAFRKPLSFEEPIRLPILNPIKKIAPYIAVDSSGQVYTWSLKVAESKWDESGIIKATYTDPQRVGNLHGVTSVVYSGNHFIAVIGDKDIVDWEELHDRGSFRVTGHGPIRTLISKKGVKAVAATSWPKVNSITGTVIEEASQSLVALFDDGTVMGWGLTSTGMATRDSTWQSVLLTKSPGAVGIAMNRSHTVVLPANGVPQFWGECGIDKNVARDPSGHPWPSVIVSGVDGYVVDVIGIALAEGNDNILSDVFIKRDGSVWAAHAPVPLGMSTSYCERPEGDKQSWKLSEGSVVAVQVASGGATILMLDADHKLWSTQDDYMQRKLHKVKINLK